jgi:hypothetical protein
MKLPLIILLLLANTTQGFYPEKRIDLRVLGIRIATLYGSLTYTEDKEGDRFRLEVQPHPRLPSPKGMNLREGFDASVLFPYNKQDTLARYIQDLHTGRSIDTLVNSTLVQDISLLPRLEDVKTIDELETIKRSERMFRGPVKMYANGKTFHANAKLDYNPKPFIEFSTTLDPNPIRMEYGFINGGNEIQFIRYFFRKGVAVVIAKPIRPKIITTPSK